MLPSHTELDGGGEDDAAVAAATAAKHIATVPLERYAEAGALFRALAAPIRLAIIDLLAAHHELYVHEIIDAVGVSQALISQHLRVLRQARVVMRIQTGRQIAYRLSRPGVDQIVTAALDNQTPERTSGPPAGTCPTSCGTQSPQERTSW
jgi:DNA-binding transcriptional ArsR family regulator